MPRVRALVGPGLVVAAAVLVLSLVGAIRADTGPTLTTLATTTTDTTATTTAATTTTSTTTTATTAAATTTTTSAATTAAPVAPAAQTLGVASTPAAGCPP